MLNKKIITTILTINDPMIMYTSDIETAILAYYNQNWANTCSSGTFIRKGVKILKYSSIVANNNTNDGSCNISVEVECDVIIYEKGDILIGEIKEIDINNQIYVTSDHTMCVIGASEATKGMSIGDKIPIYVIMISYPLRKPKITIKGIPFIKINENINYKISNVVDFDYSYLTNMIIEREKELTKLKSSKSDEYKHFEKLMTTGKSKSTESKNIQDISKVKSGEIVSRPPFLFGKPEFIIKSADTFLDLESDIVIQRVLYSYIKDLDKLITLITNYSSAEIKKIQYVWDIYNKTI
jgi:hypothetical protein